MQRADIRPMRHQQLLRGAMVMINTRHLEAATNLLHDARHAARRDEEHANLIQPLRAAATHLSREANSRPPG